MSLNLTKPMSFTDADVELSHDLEYNISVIRLDFTRTHDPESITVTMSQGELQTFINDAQAFLDKVNLLRCS